MKEVQANSSSSTGGVVFNFQSGDSLNKEIGRSITKDLYLIVISVPFKQPSDPD